MAPARMGRHDHVILGRECVEKGRFVGHAEIVMKHQDRRSLAGTPHLQLDARDLVLTLLPGYLPCCIRHHYVSSTGGITDKVRNATDECQWSRIAPYHGRASHGMAAIY